MFSDTIVVYNTADLISAHDHEYTVMYLCEFAQDLLNRLIGHNVTFRAVLIHGSFEHYYLNRVPCFFGSALIDAYDAEKAIKATGLFMHSSCQAHNRIFPTTAFDDTWSFVYLTQQMSELEDTYGGELPLPAIVVIDTDMGWFLGPEVLHLKFVYEQARTHTNQYVRAKYEKTWFFYAQRYPRSIQRLVAANFALSVVSPAFPWERLLDRTPEYYSWASRRREVRARGR